MWSFFLFFLFTLVRNRNVIDGVRSVFASSHLAMLVLWTFFAIGEGTQFWRAGLGKLVLGMPCELIRPRSIHEKHKHLFLQALKMLLESLLSDLFSFPNFLINQFFSLLPFFIDFLDFNILLKKWILPEFML